MMPRRAFGRSGVELSAFCFGTMRLVAPRFDEASATALLLELLDRGVTSFHVSHEYESYPLACIALKALRAARPAAELEVVAKIPAPHFSETAFEPAQASALIENTRLALGVDRIDLVQWMIRHTPNDDAPRLAILARDGAAAEDAWGAMKAQGRIGALAMFPYSDAMTRASLDLPWIDGLVTYLNPAELEAAPYLDGLAEAGRGFAAIRPLAAGKLADDPALWAGLDVAPEARAGFALAFSLMHPASASAILTASTPAHLDIAFDAIEAAVQDRDLFSGILRHLRVADAA